MPETSWVCPICRTVRGLYETCTGPVLRPHHTYAAHDFRRGETFSVVQPAAPAVLPPVPVGHKHAVALKLIADAAEKPRRWLADYPPGEMPNTEQHVRASLAELHASHRALLAHGGETEGGETALDERLDELFALGGDFEMATTEGAASLAAEGDRITAEIRDLFARQASALADARAALAAERERAEKLRDEREAAVRYMTGRGIGTAYPCSDSADPIVWRNLSAMIVALEDKRAGEALADRAALPTPRASEVERG